MTIPYLPMEVGDHVRLDGSLKIYQVMWMASDTHIVLTYRHHVVNAERSGSKIHPDNLEYTPKSLVAEIVKTKWMNNLKAEIDAMVNT